jgi:L-ribulose-5-phosphate 4-epimerase
VHVRISDLSSHKQDHPMSDALRETLINAGRILVDEGQGDYVWGHISVRLPDGSGRFLMKPGCIGLEELTEDNIITVDIEGEKVAGEWPRHNEVYIHSEVMRARPDVNAVLHTHPEHAIAFSSLGKPLQAMSNDGTMFSAGVPIFSETTDLITDQPRGKAVAKTLGAGNVLILRNHGIVTAGRSIEEAVFLAIKLERACRIQMLAEAAGGPKLLVKEEELKAKRARTNRADSQGNAFSYLARRWHLRCGCEVPRQYQAVLENFDRSGYKGG